MTDTNEQMLRCYDCKTHKPEGEFHRSHSRPSGRQSACKICQNARRKRIDEHFRDTDPEGYRAHNRVAAQRFRDSHREHYRNYQKLYQRAYYAKKKAALAAQAERLAAQENKP